MIPALQKSMDVQRHEESLDPSDWESLRTLSHRIVDDAIDYVRDVRERPVWQLMPDAVRSRLRCAVPVEPTPVDTVYADLAETLMPYPMGNIHPRFWMWYMGVEQLHRGARGLSGSHPRLEFGRR